MGGPEWDPEAGWTSMGIVGNPAAPEVTGRDLREKTKKRKETKQKRKQTKSDHDGVIQERRRNKKTQKFNFGKGKRIGEYERRGIEKSVKTSLCVFELFASVQRRIK